MNASNAQKARAYRNKFQELAASSIKDFLSEADTELNVFAILELIGEAVPAVMWQAEDDGLSKLAAIEGPNKAEH
jgi:hypothetical protein